ncbi:MAG: hypothetical protein WDN25_08860 [Acetobacteraceae bacterium]
MSNRNAVALLSVLLPLLLTAPGARANMAAANACAGALPRDARAIYDATLPKLGPGANLRDQVTQTTRGLAISGIIDRGNARQSGTAAGECLQRIAS